VASLALTASVHLKVYRKQMALTYQLTIELTLFYI